MIPSVFGINLAEIYIAEQNVSARSRLLHVQLIDCWIAWPLAEAHLNPGIGDQFFCLQVLLVKKKL